MQADRGDCEAMRDLPTIARDLREFIDTSGIVKVSRDGSDGVLATAGKAMRLQEILAELDQRLAAGAEADKLAAFANNLAANQQSLPPEMADVLYGNLDKLYRGKALAPGGRDDEDDDPGGWAERERFLDSIGSQPPSAPQADWRDLSMRVNGSRPVHTVKVHLMTDGKLILETQSDECGAVFECAEALGESLLRHMQLDMECLAAPSSEQPKEAGDG